MTSAKITNLFRKFCRWLFVCVCVTHYIRISCFSILKMLKAPIVYIGLKKTLCNLYFVSQKKTKKRIRKMMYGTDWWINIKRTAHHFFCFLQYYCTLFSNVFVVVYYSAVKLFCCFFFSFYLFFIKKQLILMIFSFLIY